MNNRMVMGLVVTAVVIVILVLIRGKEAPVETSAPPAAAPTPARPQASGPALTEKFALAFAGIEDADEASNIGCSPGGMCLKGHFPSDLSVRVLLQDGTACTARTGDSFHISGDGEEFDATELRDVEGCSAIDLGRDTAIAVLEMADLLDASYKWLAVREVEKPDAKLTSAAPVRALIQKLEKQMGEQSNKVKVSPVVLQAGPLKFVQVRGLQSGPEGDLLPQFGPVISLDSPTPKLISAENEFCYLLQGAFRLDEKIFVELEGASCGSDRLRTYVMEWNSEKKEWSQALATDSISF